MTFNVFFNTSHPLLGLKMAGVAGFEPANVGVKDRCLTAWRYPNIDCPVLSAAGRPFALTLKEKNGVDDRIRTGDLQSHNLAL